MRTPWALTLLQGTKKCCVRLATAILQADHDYDHVIMSLDMITIILQEYNHDYDHMIFSGSNPNLAVFSDACRRRYVHEHMAASQRLDGSQTDRDTEKRIFELPGITGSCEPPRGFGFRMALSRSSRRPMSGSSTDTRLTELYERPASVLMPVQVVPLSAFAAVRT